MNHDIKKESIVSKVIDYLYSRILLFFLDWLQLLGSTHNLIFAEFEDPSEPQLQLRPTAFMFATFDNQSNNTNTKAYLR